ncbi:Ig-like domain repeat protein [Peristeroidobacter soli]|uniref:Ig-like domain repeat protein n=1 Tax=Peristeroidobacter soli TaxID=2497877 RepID=UPI00101CD8C8|nr:Ig-like domain repeat protein [Peristeroidobacter soli]
MSQYLFKVADMVASRMCWVAALLLALSLAQSALAQSPIPLDQARNQVERSNELLGATEQIDYHNGNLAFVHRELQLSGNGGLSIEINRVYGRVRGTQSSMGAGWTLYVAPVVIATEQPSTDSLCAGTAWVATSRKYQLFHINGTKEPLWHGAAGEVRSSSNWRMTCPGGLPTLVSPAGLKFEMGSRKVVGPLGNKVAEWQATRVVDLNGNTLTIQYSDTQGSSAASPPPYVPTRIDASDGRSVVLTYTPKAFGSDTVARLTQIESAGIIYQYEYDAAGDMWPLNKAIRPDATYWSYQYFTTYFTVQGDGWKRLRAVRLPSGGEVVYNYEASPEVGLWSPPESCHVTPMPSTTEPRLLTRTTADGIWQFAYVLGLAEGEYDVTTITTPAGVEEYRHIGLGYFVPVEFRDVPLSSSLGDALCGPPTITYTRGGAWRLGLLIERKIGTNYTETNEWTSVATTLKWQYTFARVPLVAARSGSTFDYSVQIPVLARKVVTVNGAAHTTEFSNYDGYGNPGTVAESGPNGGARTTALTYYIDTTKWIVSRLKDETRTSTSTTRSFDANGRLTSRTSDGVSTSYTYDTEGNISTTTFPRGLVHTFSSYKRGIPRTEIQPEGVNLARVVSDAGQITSLTDGEGRVTSYAFDGLGRVTSITRPIGNATTIVYTQNSKTSTRGSLVETTTYDAYGRPTRVELGGVATLSEYDALGRKTFESNPGATIGTRYEYDIVDRLTKITNADNSYKVFSYGAGSATVTDERSKVTTYHFRAYGDPDRKVLMSVVAADAAANVTLTRNSVDLVTAASQAGVARSFGYDSRYYMTSETHPEAATTYERDAAGNMTARIVGGVRTDFGYDGQNRLNSVTYSDGTPAVSQTYYKTGRLNTVTSSVATRVMGYDANDNLTSESLTVDGNVLGVVYAYNARDQLSAITYPVSTRTVSYAPDVLGRPTQVSGYVNTVSYWPSGMIKQVDYANGIVTNYDQNSRLWTGGFHSRRAGTYYISSTYAYDGVGNLTGVSDAVDATMDRVLGYDNLNRLTSATGPWGTGTLGYDGAGNITSQSLGSFDLSYAYNAQNRLSGVSGSRVSSYSYDAYGNIAASAGTTYTYDGAPNLRCINCATANKIEYGYDGLAKRVKRAKSGTTTYEFYAANGDLLIEYTPTQSNKLVEYIYLGGKRIAQRVSDQLPATAITPTRSSVAIQANQMVTLTVNVGGTSPAGTVTFSEGGNLLGTVYVVNGQASIDVQGLALGTHTITATYSGDAGNSGNTVVFQIKVVNLAWLPAVLDLLLSN